MTSRDTEPQTQRSHRGKEGPARHSWERGRLAWEKSFSHEPACVTRVASWLNTLLSPFSPTARCQNLRTRN